MVVSCVFLTQFGLQMMRIEELTDLDREAMGFVQKEKLL